MIRRWLLSAAALAALVIGGTGVAEAQGPYGHHHHGGCNTGYGYTARYYSPYHAPHHAYYGGSHLGVNTGYGVSVYSGYAPSYRAYYGNPYLGAGVGSSYGWGGIGVYPSNPFPTYGGMSLYIR